MLQRDGQVETAEADVAGVFLEAVVEGIGSHVLRVNTRANGHVFVTPSFWLLTTPVGLDCVRHVLRTRRHGRRCDLPRRDIFRALRSGDCLAAPDAGGEGNAAWVCEVKAPGWDAPLELYGVPIRRDALPVESHEVPPFEGTVTLIRENVDGNNTA